MKSSQPNPPERSPFERSAIWDQLKRFAAEKAALATAAADAERKEVLPEFKSFFAAAEKGDWPTVNTIFEDVGRRFSEDEPSGQIVYVDAIQWSTVVEIWGAFYQFATGDERYSVAFGKDVIASIPPGSIYFGGTDPGRFAVAALCKSHTEADPFFTLTQNALADKGYLRYLRRIYGTRIYVPTAEDSINVFNQYIEDAQQRQKENKLKPGESLIEVGGKVQVSGQIGIMTLNGTLSKLIFDKNPDREFYIEESFPLDWTYPHLSPHGLIMRINRQPLADLSDEVVRRDQEYWMRYVKPMIGDWLNYRTPVNEVTAFIEKVHLDHDPGGFKGDPRFVKSEESQKLFSKLRSSIGSVYAWRVRDAESQPEKNRMLKEADFAFRQAFALCPRSPQAVYGYISLLMGQERLDDSTLVTETALKIEPASAVFTSMLEHLKKMKNK